MPVTKRTRYEVLKRDNHTCRYCGATAPDAILTVDHVTPVALGGTDKPDNFGSEKEPIPKPGDWKVTIWQFYGLGLPIAELEDAVTIACGNQMIHLDKTFRYMCGVLWNKVNRMQEGAKDLFEAGDTDGA